MMTKHFEVALYGDLSGRSILETVLNKRQAFENLFMVTIFNASPEMTDENWNPC